MGSKGSKVQTQSNQTYTPDPRVQQAGYQAIGGAESAAQQPFQMPAAPVAGFSPLQQQYFSQVQGGQGMALPYFDEAAQYMRGSASPISEQDVQQYYNPMAANVTAQMQNIFGQQNRDTRDRLTGAAGGVGASRIGVGQANLANQQGLAAGQTYAGLYNTALQQAQQQKNMMAGAGFGIGQLGPAAQNSYFQGTGLLGQAGAQQQALDQAQQNALYQQRLAQIAYPFQTPQYLAGIAGGLAPALGGSTAGQSTTQYPAPSALNQILGIGTAAAGIYGGMGGFGGMGGKGGMTTPYGMSQAGAGMPTYYGGSFVPTAGINFRRGGAIRSPFADGGSTYGDLASNAFANAKVGNPYSDGSPDDDQNYAEGGEVQSRYGMDEPYFHIPTRDYSKEPASLGEKAVAAAKVAAEPAARVVRGAYRLGRERLGYAEGGDIDQPPSLPGSMPPPVDSTSIVPKVSMPMGAGHSGLLGRQGISLEHQKLPQQPSGGGAGGGTSSGSGMTDTEKGIMAGAQVAMKFLPLVLARGGPVNPFDVGQGFDDGGDVEPPTFDERFPQAGEIKAGSDVMGDPAAARQKFIDSRMAGVTTGPNPLSDQSPKEPTDTEELTPRQRQPVGSNPFVVGNRDMTLQSLRDPNRPYPDSLNRDWGQNLTRSPWMSLVHAGAAMAGTAGPVGTAIGRGLAAGAGALDKQRTELRTEEELNNKADALFQHAKEHLDRYQRMTPSEQSVADWHKIVAEREKYTPVNIVKDGKPMVASYDPKTRKFYDTDSNVIKPDQIIGKHTPETETYRAGEAFKLAKDDPNYLSDPVGTLNKHRANNGLPPRGAKGQALPVPSRKEDLLNGEVYQLPNGPAVWDASKGKFVTSPST